MNEVNLSKPDYYVAGRKYEPKDIIREFNFDFNLGCAVKYISRAGRKDPSKHVEDLEKALNYLQFEQNAVNNKIFNGDPNQPYDDICSRKVNIHDEIAYYKMAKVCFDWHLSDELSLALIELVSCQLITSNSKLYLHIANAMAWIDSEIENIEHNDTPECTL